MTQTQFRDLDKLLRLIAVSHFPGETASTRLRQIAFLNLIDLEHRQGAKPTARSMSRLFSAPPSQMDSLATSLEAKGVIERVLTPALTKGKPGKVIYIRADAIEALTAHYFDVTGQRLDVSATL
ncbi:MAG TPA: hypothetical protein VN112_03845 [Ensifer sp.]|nr:hypothetical protein [Ensifer sp.]